MNPFELTTTSATKLAEAIRTGRITSETVVRAHLERIQTVNPPLNAVVQLLAETALHEARQADEQQGRGVVLGPLHGVPFTVKDQLETAGVVCTAGDERYRHHVPREDATAVARLREAGAILLGKTNVMVSNPVYGTTHNPYKHGYSPAGSRGGEAALIAAGGSPLELGSDSGGSIRQPAHNCGVAGLKPTTGRVPLTGHLPRISAMNDPRTVIGPMARFVEDLALALLILSGPDWRDASALPVPLGDPLVVPLPGLRVAVYTEHEGAAPTPETTEAVRRAAEALSRAGLHVEERVPPRVEEAYAITCDYWQQPASESWDDWEPDGAAGLPGEAVERHLFEWDRLRRALIGFMRRFDVILTPPPKGPPRLTASRRAVSPTPYPTA